MQAVTSHQEAARHIFDRMSTVLLFFSPGSRVCLYLCLCLALHHNHQPVLPAACPLFRTLSPFTAVQACATLNKCRLEA